MPLSTPMAQTVLYELHVRGFTRHPSSDVEHPGTFLGLCEKIPHLKALGITAVQLMPVLEFDELDQIHKNPLTGEQLKNYWGYSPLSFFCAQSLLCRQARRAGARIQANGENPPPGRHRSDLRCGLQPYLRRQRKRPGAQFPRTRQRHLLHARPARPLLQLLRLRQHPELQSSSRAGPDH